MCLLYPSAGRNFHTYVSVSLSLPDSFCRRVGVGLIGKGAGLLMAQGNSGFLVAADCKRAPGGVGWLEGQQALGERKGKQPSSVSKASQSFSWTPITQGCVLYLLSGLNLSRAKPPPTTDTVPHLLTLHSGCWPCTSATHAALLLPTLHFSHPCHSQASHTTLKLLAPLSSHCPCASTAHPVLGPLIPLSLSVLGLQPTWVLLCPPCSWAHLTLSSARLWVVLLSSVSA